MAMVPYLLRGVCRGFLDGWQAFFLLRGVAVAANSDFFALERKARLATERSGEASAGL